MRNLLKWIGIVLGVVVLLLIIAVGAIFAMGNGKWTRSYTPDVAVVTVPSDESAVVRGEHLATAINVCTACHGENLEGYAFLDEEGFATIYAPNLTGGAGGVGAAYTDADWARAIRHGVGRDGRGFFGMPSHFYTHMSDEDLGALIAYLKQVPPVDNQVPPRSAALLPKILMGIGAFQLEPELVAAVETDRVKPEEGISAEYGAYLVTIGACRECHGANLAGLTDPNGPPPGPNLTPGGELQGWVFEDFQQLMRTGVTPSGRQISEEMPWLHYQHMTDDELLAIWTYLESVPARQLGENE